MIRVVVQIDVDGVLADWTRGFTDLANSLWPGCVPSIGEITAPQWTGPNQFKEEAQYHKTWDYLLKTPNWWCSLKPLVGIDVFKRIATLTQKVPVYFVTNRWHYGTPANLQTAWWLREYGVPNASVICAKDKGKAAALLHTTHSIEDKRENAEDIRWCIYPAGKSYIINRLHNQGTYCPELRLDTVAQFLDIVEREI
jgi:hypothetical protein